MTALVPSRSFSDGRNFPMRSRSHNERSPKIGHNLHRFAYDRINGRNPRQKLSGNSMEPIRA